MRPSSLEGFGPVGTNGPIAATDPGRVVAWAVIDHATGSPWTCEPSQDAAERLAEQNDDTVQPLVPESLLAEAESRIVALQAQVDAVRLIADRIAGYYWDVGDVKQARKFSTEIRAALGET